MRFTLPIVFVRYAPYALLGVLVGAALVGCWSLTTTIDLTGGAGSTAAVDGGNGSDAALADGSSAEGGDGGTVDAAVVGCARFPGAFFCNDFERADAIGDTVWSHRNQPAGSSIDLITSDFVSPTHAAKISMSSGSCTFVLLEQQVPGAATRVSLRTSLRIGSASLGPLSFNINKGDGSSYPIILDVRDNGELAVMVQHVVSSNVTNFPEGSASFGGSPFGAWQDAELTLETMPKRVARARVGTTIAETDLPSEIPMTDVTTSVGIYCSNGAHTVLVDDVVVNVDR